MKYLLISLLAVCSTSEIQACWGPWYSPSGYYMYRVHNPQPEPDAADKGEYAETGRNCAAWQQLTSPHIPLEDIYRVVYEMPLDEFEKIYDSKEADGNRFIEWMTEREPSMLDFLLLAKTNEYIRTKRNSRWYYPSMKIGARMSLEEVAEKALSTHAPKLRDRYLLQAVRALFSLGRYEDCIHLWKTEVVHLPETNVMRRLIHPYIAGAEFRSQHTEEALVLFAQLGDLESMRFCAERTGKQLSTVDALELVCEYAPNSRHIEEALQVYIRKFEPNGERNEPKEYKETSDTKKLYNLCLKMARNERCNHSGMWYYTAAFLADLKGDVNHAAHLIGLAESSQKSTYIAESVKVFRMYIDAKTRSSQPSYENTLFAQLKWLDAKVSHCLTETVRKETAYGENIARNISYYYWNDMMRKILLSEVCPRMIDAGKTTLALQLANLADNRLLGIVDKQEVYGWEETEGMLENKMKGSYTMAEYRYSNHFNAHDYSNSFFEMIDSLGVDAAIRYVEKVQHPVSAFDRFLNTRGYTDSNYLNDIVGTQCLRNMRYQEAVAYLGAVSEAYKNHLNVSLQYDPFSVQRKPIQAKADFRYDFAREMLALEQSIGLTREPNKKAQLMVRYALGIKNSLDRCWPLTQYYRGINFYTQVCEKRDWENDACTQAAQRKAKELFRQAGDIVTDDEVGANIQYLLCNFKTVAQRYPNTEKGQLVRGKCDRLYDHHAEAFPPRRKD